MTRSPVSRSKKALAIGLGAVSLGVLVASPAALALRIMAVVCLLALAAAATVAHRNVRSRLVDASVHADHLANRCKDTVSTPTSTGAAADLLDDSLRSIADQHVLLTSLAEKVNQSTPAIAECERLADTPFGPAVRLLNERFADNAVELLETKRILRGTLETTADSIAVVDASGAVRFANSTAALSLPGLHANIGDVFPGWEDLPVDPIELERNCRDRSATIEIAARPILGDSEPLWVIRWREVDDSRSQARIRHLASHDSLTGLLNRPGLIEAHARLSNSGQSLVAIHIDLEGFQTINHHHGFAKGDQVLRELAYRLAYNVPPESAVARIDADQFMVVFPGDPCRAEAIADTVADQCGKAVRFSSGGRASINLRAGWAVGAAADDNLLEHATCALHDAKASGLQIAEYDRAAAEAIRQDRTTELELREAISEGQFVLFGQPIVDVLEGRTIGIELLIRWVHPSARVLEAADFLPMVERCNLIDEVDRWVVGEAAEYAMHTKPDLQLSVNLSCRFLSKPDNAHYVVDEFRRAGVAAGRIQVEIAEADRSSNPQGVIDSTRILTNHGIRVALDDFGTGHASLANLLQMNASTIKIDGVLVRMVTEPAGQGVVNAIMGYARDRGLTVVAEGVETKREADALASLGCRFQQGFVHHRPAPLEAVLSMVAQGSTWLDLRDGSRLSSG